MTYWFFFLCLGRHTAGDGSKEPGASEHEERSPPTTATAAQPRHATDGVSSEPWSHAHPGRDGHGLWKPGRLAGSHVPGHELGNGSDAPTAASPQSGRYGHGSETCGHGWPGNGGRRSRKRIWAGHDDESCPLSTADEAGWAANGQNPGSETAKYDGRRRSGMAPAAAAEYAGYEWKDYKRHGGI